MRKWSAHKGEKRYYLSVFVLFFSVMWHTFECTTRATSQELITLGKIDTRVVGDTHAMIVTDCFAIVIV